MKTLTKNGSPFPVLRPKKNLSRSGRYFILLAKCVPRKLAKLKALQEIWPSVSERDQCLDVGTGSGGITYFYSQKGNWTFLDKNPENFLTAKQFLRGEFCEKNLVEHLEASPGNGLISIIDTIIYFENPSEIVSRAYQNLAPQGHLVVSGIEQRKFDLLMYARRLLGIQNAVGNVSNPNSAEMKNMLESAGFSEVQILKYFGPFGQLSQTLVDCFLLKSAEEGDRLSRAPSKLQESGFFISLLCPLAQVFSAGVNLLDGFFFFLPRYAYVAVAKKSTL